MKPYRVALVSIGNEVLSGDTLNTNAQWLAQQLTHQGALIVEQRAVGDAISTIIETIAELRTNTDLVITTGGLGPTHDDMTVAALCEYFHDELVPHQPTVDYLKQYASERGRAISDRLLHQAMVPASAQVLPNRVGTAPGLLFERTDGASVMVLPGVPREMEAIMLESGLPWLSRTIAAGNYDVVAERVLVTAGIPESDLADRIEPIRERLPQSVELAFLPSPFVVRLRLRAIAPPQEAERQLEAAVSLITSVLDSVLITDRDERLVEVLQRECIARNKTVAVAESCTGGMLGAEITSVSGSSAYFLGGLICYADAVKIHFGGVRPETLAMYGAVSQQTVEELACYLRAAYGSDLAVAISGIAGPGGGSEDKPVGTVWIAVADEMGTETQRFFFGNDRQTNRQRACQAAIVMLLTRLRAEQKVT